MCFENAEVLACIPPYYKMRIREALEIEKSVNNLNKDDGLKLKEAWKLVVRFIRNIPNSHNQQNSSPID